MKILTIYSKGYIEHLVKLLSDINKSFTNSGIFVLEKKFYQDTTILKIEKLDEDADIEGKIAEAILYIIKNHFSVLFLRSILVKKYDMNHHEQINQVIKISKEKQILEMVFNEDEIVSELKQILMDTSEINIEGFINFRLKESLKILETLFSIEVIEYLKYQEYESFINLLKFYVKSQSASEDTVHIIGNENKSYQFFDKNEKDITKNAISNFIDEMSSNNYDYDDILVNYLITLLPEKIVIHQEDSMQNRNVLHTIRKVFQERVSVCNDCHLCKHK